MSGLVLVSTADLERAGRVRDAFEGEGFSVELVTSGEKLKHLDGVQLLLLTSLDAESGAEGLLRQVQEHGIPCFAIHAGPRPQVEQTGGLGITEVFSGKADPREIALMARALVQRRHLQEITGIVGETDAVRQALERVVQIAPVQSTVLVTGESGTGKELVARGIHALSPRRHEPFIAVNLAALSDTLLESELFGHEKGAFTGAIDLRKGLFELADGGTIFLDEIGEMPLTTQTKLLRVLEQREFHRVGGETLIRVDVRIVVATNQDLRYAVTMGDFRKDLYYRINVLNIELPPLRERQDDIEILVRAFVKEASERLDRPFPGISAEAMEILREYHWPGNVRELKNLVESMVVLAPGRVIEAQDIPEEVRIPSAAPLLPVSRDRLIEAGEGAGRTLRPELEFVFRTLVDLRVDMDDLRRQFEVYQSGSHGLSRVDGASYLESDRELSLEGEIVQETVSFEPFRPLEEASAPPDPEGTVVYRSGMTMADLEREAIVMALAEVGGNRRKAAEMLGIGERTLYRKIKLFELDPQPDP